MLIHGVRVSAARTRPRSDLDLQVMVWTLLFAGQQCWEAEALGLIWCDVLGCSACSASEDQWRPRLLPGSKFVARGSPARE